MIDEFLYCNKNVKDIYINTIHIINWLCLLSILFWSMTLENDTAKGILTNIKNILVYEIPFVALCKGENPSIKNVSAAAKVMPARLVKKSKNEP